MEVKEFLKNKLSELAIMFPGVAIVYAYNNLAETHIVELTPQLEYYHNTALDEAWFNISTDFLTLFPFESVSFVSDDSKLINTLPELEYNVVMATTRAMDNTFYSNLINHNFNKYNLFFATEFKSSGIDQQKSKFKAVATEEINSEFENAGEYSYAMAA